MSSLILPASYQFNQEREAMVQAAAERKGALMWFDRQLKDIDPLLDLVKATGNAQAPGMRPGFWHVRRRNPAPAIDTYIPITTPDGEFCEPSTWWLEDFRRDDAWNNGGWAEMQRRWDRRALSQQREKDRHREDRIEELAGRIKAKTNPAVSFSDNKWTYRAGARDGR